MLFVDNIDKEDVAQLIKQLFVDSNVYDNRPINYETEFAGAKASSANCLCGTSLRLIRW